MTDEDQKLSTKIALFLGWKRDFINTEQWHTPECDAPVKDGTCCYGYLPDFVNNAGRTLWMLEKMKEPELWKETETDWSIVPDLMQEGPDDNPNYVLVTGKDLGRVVAECFARSNHL